MNDKPKPIQTFRIGTIQAAVWSNPGQHGPFYNVTIDRRFRDADEKWQSSNSFGRDDLLVVAKIADAAHTYICERQAEDRTHSEGNGSKNGDGASHSAEAEAAPRNGQKRRTR